MCDFLGKITLIKEEASLIFNSEVEKHWYLFAAWLVCFLTIH